MAELREALLDAVTPDDLKAIGRSIVEAAKAGDVAAAKLILDRLLGREPLVDTMHQHMHLHGRSAEQVAMDNAVQGLTTEELRDAIRRLSCTES